MSENNKTPPTELNLWEGFLIVGDFGFVETIHELSLHPAGWCSPSNRLIPTHPMTGSHSISKKESASNFLGSEADSGGLSNDISINGSYALGSNYRLLIAPFCLGRDSRL